MVQALITMRKGYWAGRTVCEMTFADREFYSISYDDHTGLIAIGGVSMGTSPSLYLTALLGYDLADPHWHKPEELDPSGKINCLDPW